MWADLELPDVEEGDLRDVVCIGLWVVWGRICSNRNQPLLHAEYWRGVCLGLWWYLWTYILAQCSLLVVVVCVALLWKIQLTQNPLMATHGVRFWWHELFLCVFARLCFCKSTVCMYACLYYATQTQNQFMASESETWTAFMCARRIVRAKVCVLCMCVCIRAGC